MKSFMSVATGKDLLARSARMSRSALAVWGSCKNMMIYMAWTWHMTVHVKVMDETYIYRLQKKINQGKTTKSLSAYSPEVHCFQNHLSSKYTKVGFQSFRSLATEVLHPSTQMRHVIQSSKKKTETQNIRLGSNNTWKFPSPRNSLLIYLDPSPYIQYNVVWKASHWTGSILILHSFWSNAQKVQVAYERNYD